MTLRILVGYHSDDGQTAKIAARIAQLLGDTGCIVGLETVDGDPSPAGYDGVVFGDSIHVGRHSHELKRWIGRHRHELERVPSALFQVSLTSADHDDHSVAEAKRMARELGDAANLSPAVVGLFAGALPFSRYGRLKRLLMRQISAARGGETDTTQDYEYTDWRAVEQFAADVEAAFTARSMEAER